MSRPMTERFFGANHGRLTRRGRVCAFAFRALFALAAVLLIASYSQPYWKMTLHAPQYPQGLSVQAYLHGLTGDVDEIDGLNHYIGMRPLEEAAQLERKLSPVMIASLVILLVIAMCIRSRWVLIPTLPVVLFPPGFLLDLLYWLHTFGQNLDPTAALSSSVKPFTPPVLGVGKVGNFHTVAGADTGLYMAAIASCLVIAGLIAHHFSRRAHARPRSASGEASTAAVSADRKLAASILAACLGLLVANAPEAQANAAPPFDIASAIMAANDNQTITVPPGVYAGPITIDRPISLVAAPGAVIDAGGSGHAVRITAPGVTLSGFTIRNTGASLNNEDTGVLVLAPEALIENNTLQNVLFGISLKDAPRSVVRGNTISGLDIHIARRGDGVRVWTSHDSRIEDNTVDAVRDVVVWFSERVVLSGNRVTRSRYGLHFMYCHENTLVANHLENNSVGAFLMYSRDIAARDNIFSNNRGPSGYGIGLKDMQGVTIENNAIVGNRVGIYFDNPPIEQAAHDDFRGNLIAFNDVGVTLQPLVSQVAIFENSFIENLQHIGIRGGGQLRGNELTRDGRGNYWSDYRGLDRDGDGVGDIEHRVESLWDSLVDREPALRLFIHSPAQRAIELAAAAFPVVKPRPVVTDEAPLMRPPHQSPTLRAERNGRPLALLSLGLLGLAAAVLAAGLPLRTPCPTRSSLHTTNQHRSKASS